MNLDLLIKLVKLANNNHNEHEANSAARRACKLIAEGNYKFSEVKAQPKVEIRQPQPWPGNSNPTRPPQPASNPTGNPFEDYFRHAFWGGFDWAKAADEEDERRRRQNQQRTHEPGPSQKVYDEQAPFSKEQADFLRDRARKQQNTYRPSQAQQDFYNQQNAYKPHMGFDMGQEQKKPKTRRVCSRCNVDVETNNTKNVFVCTICQWKEFHEKTGNKFGQF